MHFGDAYRCQRLRLRVRFVATGQAEKRSAGNRHRACATSPTWASMVTPLPALSGNLPGPTRKKAEPADNCCSRWLRQIAVAAGPAAGPLPWRTCRSLRAVSGSPPPAKPVPLQAAHGSPAGFKTVIDVQQDLRLKLLYLIMILVDRDFLLLDFVLPPSPVERLPASFQSRGKNVLGRISDVNGER